MKQTKGLIIIGVVLLPLLALAAYVWGLTLVESLMVYRSPLRNAELPLGVPAGPGLTRRVVLVIVDGLRTDTAADPQCMPFLDELRAQGVSATMHSQPPSFSQTSWTTLVSGAAPELNDAGTTNTEQAELGPITVDHLFVAAHDAGLRTALAGHEWWAAMVPAPLRDLSFFNPGLDAEDDREVADAALPWLRDPANRFVLVHFDQVDETGHLHRADGPEWAQAARNVDGLIEELAAELDFSQDTLVVVSDHGHVDRGGHGGQEAIVLQQPLVMVGAGVQPDQLGDVRNVDLAPTLAMLLGTRVPAAGQGRVLWETLQAPAELREAGDAAVLQARTALAGAYLDAIARSDAAGSTPDERMSAGRAARSRAECWPRAVLAGAAALLPLPLLWWRRGKALLAVLLGGLTCLVVSHLLFLLVERNAYSLSTLGSMTQVVGQGALNAALGLLAGVGLAFLLGQGLKRGGSHALSLALGTTWWAVYLASLPVLVGFAADGPLLAWRLPGSFLRFFLYFNGLVQVIFFPLFGLVFSGLAAALGGWLERRRGE